MPPRTSTKTRGFAPSADAQTYRDLWMFEQRLKSNAAQLQYRKFRYQLFLYSMLALFAGSLSETLGHSSWTAPIDRFLLRLVSAKAEETETYPFVASLILCITLTCVVLIFAGGLYHDKIAYANKYVPHANRALRSFNMHLNVRKPPLTSRAPFYYLSLLFPRSSQPQPHNPASAGGTTSRSPSPTQRNRSESQSNGPTPITPIPPSSNPLGELIFSSRVDRQFREGYERHRANLDRIQQELQRARRPWPFSLWSTPATEIRKSSTPPVSRGRVTATLSESADGKDPQTSPRRSSRTIRKGTET